MNQEIMKMPKIYTRPEQSEKTVQMIGDMDMLEEKLPLN